MDCLPEDVFQKIIIMRERIVNLENIIKSTH